MSRAGGGTGPIEAELARLRAERRRDRIWYAVGGAVVLLCFFLFGPYAFLAVFIGLFMVLFVWMAGDGGKKNGRMAYLEEALARQREADENRRDPWGISRRREPSAPAEDETARTWEKVGELRARGERVMARYPEKTNFDERTLATHRAEAADTLGRRTGPDATVEDFEERADVLARIYYLRTLLRGLSSLEEDRKRRRAETAGTAVSPRMEAHYAWQDADHELSKERKEQELAEYERRYARLTGEG